MLFTRDEHVWITEEWRCKDEPLAALCTLIQKTQNLTLACFGKIQAFVPVVCGHKLKHDTRSGRNQRQKVCGYAHMPASRVYALIGNPVRINAEGNFVVIFKIGALSGCEHNHIMLRANGIKSTGRYRQCQQQHAGQSTDQYTVAVIYCNMLNRHSFSANCNGPEVRMVTCHTS